LPVLTCEDEYRTPENIFILKGREIRKNGIVI